MCDQCDKLKEKISHKRFDALTKERIKAGNLLIPIFEPAVMRLGSQTRSCVSWAGICVGDFLRAAQIGQI
jgi:hypothetical protein